MNELHLQKWILIVQCKVIFSSSLQARQFELHQYVFTRIYGTGTSKELQRFIKDSFCFSSRTPNRAPAPRFSVSLKRINKIFLTVGMMSHSWSALSEKTALNSFTHTDVIFPRRQQGANISTSGPSLYSLSGWFRISVCLLTLNFPSVFWYFLALLMQNEKSLVHKKY